MHENRAFCRSIRFQAGPGTGTLCQQMGNKLNCNCEMKEYDIDRYRELPTDYKGVLRNTYGQNVYYDLPDPNLKQASQWLISNPNRVNLGRIGLRYKGNALTESSITNVHQRLDLWNGTITSMFQIDGVDVHVTTQGDFESDAVAFNISSSLVEAGVLDVQLDFPFPPIHTATYKYEVRPKVLLRLVMLITKSIIRSLLGPTISLQTTLAHLLKIVRTVLGRTFAGICRNYNTL